MLQSCHSTDVGGIFLPCPYLYGYLVFLCCQLSRPLLNGLLILSFSQFPPLSLISLQFPAQIRLYISDCRPRAGFFCGLLWGGCLLTRNQTLAVLLGKRFPGRFSLCVFKTLSCSLKCCLISQWSVRVVRTRSLILRQPVFL